MAQYVPEFNSANTEDRVQIDSARNALKVYTGSWQTHTFGGYNQARDSWMLGTTTPLLAETIPLSAANTNGVIGASGLVTSVAVYLPKGLVVTSIGHMAATTGYTSGTHEWAAIYDTQATPALIGQSTDVTSGTTWAAYTMIKHTLATAYQVPTSGVYYLSLSVTGTSPTLLSQDMVSLTAATGASYQTGAYNLACTHGSAVAGTAPATLATPTVLRYVPWVGVF
jgi:hypothetical protein